MSTVARRLEEQTLIPQQVNVQSGNEVRSFCDMLYYQLVDFDKEEFEDVQFEIQNVIRQHRRSKRLQQPSQASIERSQSVMSNMSLHSSSVSNYDSTSVYSAVGSAYDSINSGADHDFNYYQSL